ncbi:SCO7613 C-terminal domain-containing membrane protein [Actinomadura yumaensis]|uniref:SCO7613 C-terminal domain-containing membrane protein n=1 Tax=Actinomadura yumaensis TaxID=111807 RepID=A0ABW2CZD8_9ACTN
MQNLLLLLGGLLLGIAAVVFTVVSWGHLGVRAAVLVTVTALALAAPWPLARRRLSSTAETVAFIGLVLVPLSGLAVANAVIGHSSDPGGLNESGSGGAGLWPVVAGTAALAALWAGYARAAPLRLPGPTALAIAHVPLPLAAYEAGPTPAGAALALLLTAALDLAVRWFARERAGSLERAVAEVAGLFAGLVGAAVALAASFAADGPAAGLRASGVLALAVALAWVCAGSGDGQEVRAAFSAGAGTPAAAATAAPAAKALPVRWAPAVYAVAACAVLASAARLPERTRPGVAGAGAVALGLAAVAVAPDVVAALVGPLGAFGGMWSGHAPVWTGRPAAPAAAAVAAVAAGGLAFRREVRARPGAARDGCRIAAVLCAASAVVAVPGAAGLPRAADAALLLGAGAVLLGAGAYGRTVPFAPVAAGSGAAVAVLASAWSVAGAAPVWAPAAAGAAVVLLLGCAAAARTEAVQVGAGAGTVLAGGGLVAVLWAVNGWSQPSLPFALLAVPLVALLPCARAPDGLARAVSRSRRDVRTVVLGAALAVLPGTALRDRRPAQSLAVGLAASGVTLAAVATAASAGVAPGGRPRQDVLALTLALGALLAAAGAWSRRGSAQSAVPAYVLAGLAPLPVHDSFVPSLFGPFAWLGKAWTADGPGTARGLLSPGEAWTARPVLMPVLALAALAAVLAATAHQGRWAGAGVVRVAGPVALAPLPLAADLPYWAALAFLVGLTAGLALWAALSRTTAGATALWTAALAASWSLADRTATLSVLAALALAGLACAVRGGDSRVSSVASAVTALAVGAEGAAVALAGDLPARSAAFVVLGVAVLIVRAAALPLDRPHAAHALRLAGAALWAVSVAMASGDPLRAALVLAAGGLTAVLAAGRLRGAARDLALGGGWPAAAVALVPPLALLAAVMADVCHWPAHPWSGGYGTVRDTLPAVPDVLLPPAAAAAGALGAAIATASARLLLGPAAAHRAATITVPPALLCVLAVADPPYAAALGVAFALAVALAVATAAAPRGPDTVSGAAALAVASTAVAWSLTARLPTLAVVAGTCAVAAGCALAARRTAVRAAADATAILAAGGLTAAASLAAGGTPPPAAFPVLASSVPAAVLAARLARRAQPDGTTVAVEALAVEAAGYAVTACGVGLAFADLAYASAALTGAGALALAVAARADRRRAAWAGAAALHLALWIRLGLSGVDAPEAYTLPVTVIGVAAGHRLLRRRGGAFSSWPLYGPALALTLLPSLAVAWTDPGLVRPLLLASAAFAVTLAGALGRLQAPLLIGGGVLVLNAAHELFPALADLVGDGPRWLPIAVTGAALLFAGATYEHRLRDLRRLRASLTAMR